MSAAEILKSFERRGHRFAIQDGQLTVASPRGRLTDADKEVLRANKASIVTLLTLSEHEVAEAMSRAIEELAHLCPVDLFDRLDHRQERTRRTLSAMPLKTPGDVQRWKDGWRIIFAEIRIDQANLGGVV